MCWSFSEPIQTSERVFRARAQRSIKPAKEIARLLGLGNSSGDETNSPVIRVYDDAGKLIETHERRAISASFQSANVRGAATPKNDRPRVCPQSRGLDLCSDRPRVG